MDSMQIWLNHCIDHIVDDFKEEENINITASNVFVVWSCKTLQNKKALLSTNISGNTSYYECTYDGVHERTYFDKYKKVNHKILYDIEL